MIRCRLCERERRLLRSHVVPEFFYRPVYGKNHRLYTRVDGRLARLPPLQRGLRERLLCAECEQRFGTLEAHVRQILYGKVATTALEPYSRTQPLEVTRDDTASSSRVSPDSELGFWTRGQVQFRGVDYTTVRFFGLSVLWRMAVASHVMWQSVQLTDDEQAIKAMITRGDVEPYDRYPFVCMIPLFGGRFFPDFILQPDRIEAADGFVIRTVLGGYLFVFLGAGPYRDDTLTPFFVRPDGLWTLPIVDAMDLDFLRYDAAHIESSIRAEAWSSGVAQREP